VHSSATDIDDFFFEPSVHSPLENLVDIAQQV
jgi:hypothetical protein